MKVIKILKGSFCYALGTTRAIITYIIDTIAPPDLAVRAVENMSVEQFIESANDVGGKLSGKLSGKCAEQPKPIDGVLHLFPYRTDSGTIRTALVTIKTYYNPRLVKIIAGASYRVLRERLCLHGKAGENSDEKISEQFVLIPVPMTRKSLRVRGWNQCELICKEMARLDNESSTSLFDYKPNVLKKIRETADQVGHGRAGRFENLKNSCAVRDGCTDVVCGKNIIVLDDIVTTGSTLSEARRALIAAGAKTVLCVAVAH